MKLKELIEKLEKYNQNNLFEYDFLGIYENEGQIELHVKEGEKL